MFFIVFRFSVISYQFPCMFKRKCLGQMFYFINSIILRSDHRQFAFQFLTNYIFEFGFTNAQRRG